jgi:2-succinyl-5-enolpyruvyl-6-hydroxy-3-cyclohexene-1-carboxylate synthase
VLRIGAIPTSKPLQQFLERAERTIVVDPGGWRDPSSLATDLLHVDPTQLCRALLRETAAQSAGEWPSTWIDLNMRTRQAVDRHLSDISELFEGKVFAALAELLAPGSLVYAGNSMPVRDLDTFLPKSERRLVCLSNRGANGIDGVVSSALGASAAGMGPVVLVIGDISFYHDLNGLLAAARHHLDLMVVLLNNDGGGIFSFLPQAELDAREFELLFGTPHGLDFQPFVEAYGGNFTRACDWTQFSEATRDALSRGGLNVVEVPTDRARNVVQHRGVWQAVADALSPAAVA